MLNYSTFVNDLISKLQTHSQLNTVRTGLISDLSFPKDGAPIIYPYAFIMNDKYSFSANGGSSTFTVNLKLILMDRYTVGAANEQSQIIDKQSNMMMVLQDILSYYAIQQGCSVPYEILLPMKVEGKLFAESYRDTVAGVSATIPFTVRQPLDATYWPTKVII